MRKLFLLSIPILIILVTGCAVNEDNLQQVTVESFASYQALLNVNGDQYFGVGNSEEINSYQTDKQIGEVKKKISPELYPYKSFESNYLEEGTQLYSLKEHPNFLLAEVEPGVYELFSKN